jgi:hypothetical protein
MRGEKLSTAWKALRSRTTAFLDNIQGSFFGRNMELNGKTCVKFRVMQNCLSYVDKAVSQMPFERTV